MARLRASSAMCNRRLPDPVLSRGPANVRTFQLTQQREVVAHRPMLSGQAVGVEAQNVHLLGAEAAPAWRQSSPRSGVSAGAGVVDRNTVAVDEGLQRHVPQPTERVVELVDDGHGSRQPGAPPRRCRVIAELRVKHSGQEGFVVRRPHLFPYAPCEPSEVEHRATVAPDHRSARRSEQATARIPADANK